MKEAVVFGCGGTAREYKNKILERFRVTAYTSNHPESWGKTIDAIPVIPPKDIPEQAAIVVASKFYLEIIRGLPQKYIEEKRVYMLLRGEIVPVGFEEDDTGKLVMCHSDFEARPTTLNIAFSGSCNSRCRYCVYHSEHSQYHFQGFITEDAVNELLRQIRPITSLQTLALIGTGETLLHPQWQEFAARILNTYGAFKKCVVYTNGMLLTKENAEKLKQLPVPHLELRISIDGASPEDCEYWRKGEQFSVIRKNLNQAYDILGGMAQFVITGCVVLPASINVDSAFEVDDYLKRSCEWRKQEFPFAKHTNHLALPFVDHIPGTKAVHAAVFPCGCTCKNPFNIISVRSNGDIISCGCGYVFKNDAACRIGNILTDQLADIFYHHEVYRRLRADLSNRKRPELCGACNQLGGSRILCLQRTE